jgi:hypothetical protein
MDDLNRLTTLAKLSRGLAAQATQPSEREALLTIAEWYACEAVTIGNTPPPSALWRAWRGQVPTLRASA